MPATDDDHTGKRIADYRKRAGLTQKALAARIPYSYSLVRQVEDGSRTASSGLVAAVAEALHIDVAALKGQPYVTQLKQDRLIGLIRPIREALDLYDLGDDPDLEVRPAAQLVAAADGLCRTVRATKLHTAATDLPPLVAELTAAAYRTPSTDLWAALSSTYRTAHDVATKLGYSDLSSVALDRMGWAAERASDPLLAAARQYMRALAYFREGQCSIGLRLIGSGRGHLEQAEPGRAQLAVAGQLHLGDAVLHARDRRGADTDTHLAEAEEYAARTGEAGDVLWLSFGPTNVSLHRTSTLIELHQYGEAAEVAAAVNFPAGWAHTSRQAHHHVHRAYALMETRRYGQALEQMVTARRIAPEQTRYYPPARETVHALVRQARRTPDTLDHMAAWIGV